MDRRALVTGGSGFLGTHVVAALVASGRRVLNVSTSAPRDPSARAAFVCADVRDGAAIERAMASFRPDEVIHLAARTGFVGRSDPEGHEVNVMGTESVARAARRTGTVRRFVLASSNVVDFESPVPTPLLSYGASKALAEQVIATAGLPCSCIVRPCYAWGPWFGAPFRGFFLAIARQRYMHLGTVSPPKLMGYAGNMAFQIEKICDAPEDLVSGKTFYLADDAPFTLRTWAAAIACEMGVPPPATLPEPLAMAAARAGDMLCAIGFRDPPLTSTRLANMRRCNTSIPIEATREVAGRLPFSMRDGVRETVRWLRDEGLLPAERRRTIHV